MAKRTLLRGHRAPHVAPQTRRVTVLEPPFPTSSQGRGRAAERGTSFSCLEFTSGISCSWVLRVGGGGHVAPGPGFWELLSGAAVLSVTRLHTPRTFRVQTRTERSSPTELLVCAM